MIELSSYVAKWQASDIFLKFMSKSIPPSAEKQIISMMNLKEVKLDPGGLAWSGFVRAAYRARLDIDFVIHVGANTGQELNLYSLAKVNTVQIEPDPIVYAELKKECINYSGKIVHFPLNCAISDHNGTIRLNRYENTCHNSTLERLPNGTVSDVVKRITVKSYTFTEFLSLPKIEKITKERKHIMLVVDTQGHESKILSSIPILEQGSNLLSIYCEVSHNSTYYDNPAFSEINSIMESKGYLLDNVNFSQASGNALYSAKNFFELN